MTTKTYFRTRDFTTLPDTFIQVGHIVSDATDPLSTLNADDYSPPPPATIQKSSQRGFSGTRSQIRSGKVGLWAQIIEGASAGIGANASRDKEDVYAIETVETQYMWLAKKEAKEYVKSAVAGEDVKSFLDAVRYKVPVFLITGVKVARGAKSISENDTRNKGAFAKVMLDGTPIGIPLKVGPELEGKSGSVSETKFDGGDDFVFAYQLRKLVCSQKKPMKDEAYAKGAMFEADAKKILADEVEVDLGEEDLGFGDFQDAEVIHIQDEGEGDKDICIVVKDDA